MSNTVKKILSLLLCFAMLFSVLPAAFAEGEQEKTAEEIPVAAGEEEDAVGTETEEPEPIVVPENTETAEEPEPAQNEAEESEGGDPAEAADSEPEEPAVPGGEEPEGSGTEDAVITEEPEVIETDPLLPAETTKGTLYGSGDWSNGYGWWSQAQSTNADFRGYGCLLVAQAKMLVMAGAASTDSTIFNPEIFWQWSVSKGYTDSGLYTPNKTGPQAYAALSGVTLTYEGMVAENNLNKVWDNINAGRYTILRSYCPDSHFILVNNGASKETGTLRIFESWNSPNTPCPGTRDFKTSYTDKGYTIAEILTYTPAGATPLHNAPTVNVTTNGGTVTISWNNVGADSYYVYIYDKDHNVDLTGTNVGTALSYTWYNQLPAGNYRAYVAGCWGDTPYYGNKDFTIAGTSHEAPTVSATVNGQNVTISWNSVGANSYYVYILDRDNNIDLTGTNVGTALTYNWPNQLSYGSYSAYVTANFTNEQKTGHKDFVIVNTQTPVAPTVTAAVNGTSATISWNDVNADSYELHVYNTSTGDVAFSKAVGSSLTETLELSIGPWEASVTAFFGSQMATGSATFEIAPLYPSGNCGLNGDNLTWVLDDTGTLTITGSGEMARYSMSQRAPWYDHRTEIRKVIIGSGATSIGNSAFEQCTVLTNVTLPSTLVDIETAAFRGCSTLASITLPEGLKHIYGSAFALCTSLTGITIPASVEIVAASASSAFAGCSAMTEFRVAAGNTTYCAVNGILYTADQKKLVRCPCGKTGAITIPAGVTQIESYAFDSCGAVTSVVIPAGVTLLSEGVFDGCSNLASVTIPESVTAFGDYVFTGCASLTEVTIPPQVALIGSSDFGGCTALEKITFTSAVTKVLQGAFYNCPALSDVYFIGNGEEWGRIDIQTGNDPLLTAALHYPEISMTELRLTVNATCVLHITDGNGHVIPVSWQSTDPTIATVAEQGMVTALKSGTARIQARYENGTVLAGCTVKVVFSDVADPSRYFYEPVYWALDNGITTGAGGPGLFSPDNDCTREQVVTFLWRLFGSPEPKTFTSFTDVPTNAWYYKPICWAAEQGITVGLNDGTGRFGVGQSCTRAMCVTFLWRAAGKPAPHTQGNFTDMKPGAYYVDAVSWAAENNITVGLNDGTGRFGINNTCTRAMIVTFLYRFAHRN